MLQAGAGGGGAGRQRAVLQYCHGGYGGEVETAYRFDGSKLPTFKIGLSINPLFLLRYVYIFKPINLKERLCYSRHSLFQTANRQKPYLQIRHGRATCPIRPAV